MEPTVAKDLENATLTVTASFAHPIERVWALYADPRKLERWWGPPGYRPPWCGTSSPREGWCITS